MLYMYLEVVAIPLDAEVLKITNCAHRNEIIKFRNIFCVFKVRAFIAR